MARFVSITIAILRTRFVFHNHCHNRNPLQVHIHSNNNNNNKKKNNQNKNIAREKERAGRDTYQDMRNEGPLLTFQGSTPSFIQSAQGVTRGRHSLQYHR